MLNLGWRNADINRMELYSSLILSTGVNPRHTSPTVLIIEEVEDNSDMINGRAGPSVSLPDQFINLIDLL